ncbi:MAG TPA: NAD(P)-dependent oxidoreductase [Terriglobales bacterium]|nr:NAD(P)-dependent oxidoreductase [Terriglobales bacterium]
MLITGAAGRIGSVLRERLRGHAPLRLLDIRAMPSPAAAGEELVRADIRDAGAVAEAMAGCAAVVHLAGIPSEVGFEELLDTNIRGTYHVLEAARQSEACRRVILGSSNHVTGFYPADQTITALAPPRPDGLYGVSKAYGEVLGRLYHEKHGLEVVAIRIGSFAPRPTSPRHAHTWISPRDMTQLVLRCLEAPDVGWLVVYGTSDNGRSYWDDRDVWTRLGYAPEDSADGVLDGVGGDPFQGGELASLHPRWKD